MSIVKNLGCVFFLYFPIISINDLQIQKFCPKKNFALWIELSAELNQNRSFQARNIWQSKYDQNSCNCTSNETHAAPKKAPLWTPLGAAFVHKLPNFLAFPFLRRICGWLRGEIPNITRGSSCMDSISSLKMRTSSDNIVMHQMFNGFLVFFVLIFNLCIFQHMQSVMCWHACPLFYKCIY